MEISDFEPKDWNMDKSQFGQVTVVFVDVSTSELHKITEMVNNLTSSQVSGNDSPSGETDVLEEDDEDESEESTSLRDKVISIMGSKKGTISVSSMANEIFGKHYSLQDKKQIQNIAEDLVKEKKAAMYSNGQYHLYSQ